MKKLILIPITLTTLTPMVSMVGCGNPDTPTPPVPEEYLAINGLQEGYEGTVGSPGNTGDITISRYNDGKVTDVTDQVTITPIAGPARWSEDNKRFEWPGTLDKEAIKCSFEIDWLRRLTLTCEMNLDILPREPFFVYEGGLESEYYVDFNQPGKLDQLPFCSTLPKQWIQYLLKVQTFRPA